MSFAVDTTEPCEEAAVINRKCHRQLDNGSQEQGGGGAPATRLAARLRLAARNAPRGGSESAGCNLHANVGWLCSLCYSRSRADL